MKSTVYSTLPMLLKVVLPSVLTALGTTVSVLNSEAFRAFCGLQ